MSNTIKDWDRLEKCKFWEYADKKSFKQSIAHYRNQYGLLEILINELDNIKIKN